MKLVRVNWRRKAGIDPQVRTRERNGALVPIRDRLLDTEVEDAGTAGLRIVSWIGLVAKRSEIQM
jgi:hypothetical protein